MVRVYRAVCRVVAGFFARLLAGTLRGSIRVVAGFFVQGGWTDRYIHRVNVL